MKELHQIEKNLKIENISHNADPTIPGLRNPAEAGESIKMTSSERHLFEAICCYENERCYDAISTYLRGIIQLIITYGHGKILPDNKHYFWVDDHKAIYIDSNDKG